MDRLKVFDRALLGKKVGGNSAIVIIDTIYIISGVVFGRMFFLPLLRYVLLVNILVTCILYQNFIISRGDMKLELITEKIIYYPTTRFQFLLHKYAKTLIFLLIQVCITLVSLYFGYYGNRGQLDIIRVIGCLMTVFIGVLLTSGTCLLVMHTMPLGVYLAMILYLPLFLGMGIFEKVLIGEAYVLVSIPVTLFLIVIMVMLLWMLLLWIGVKIFEKVGV